MNDIVRLIIYLLLIGVLIYVVQLVLAMLTLPSQIKTIILIVISLVVLLWMLNSLGIFTL